MSVLAQEVEVHGLYSSSLFAVEFLLCVSCAVLCVQELSKTQSTIAEGIQEILQRVKIHIIKV